MKNIILMLSVILAASPALAKKRNKRRRRKAVPAKPAIVIDQKARAELENVKKSVNASAEELKNAQKAINDAKATIEKMQKCMKNMHEKHKAVKSEMAKLKKSNEKLVKDNEKLVKLSEKLENRGAVLLPKGWTLKLGGFINLDTYYSTEEVFHLDSPAWAVQKSKSRGSALGFSARNTRIRMALGAPSIGKLKTSGVLEMDFYGNLPASVTSIRTAQLRMRLAYASLQYEDFTIHLGNDWMVAAPQFETGADPFNLWTQGNLWMRIPQIKFLYNHKFNNSLKLEYGMTIGDSMAGDGPKNTMIRSMGIGENSSMPVVQARLGLGFKIGKSKWSTIGISGSYQKLDFHGAPSDEISSSELATLEAAGSDKIASYFVAADAKIMAAYEGYKFRFTAEGHFGQAIGMFWGGILQTYQFVKDANGTITDVNPVRTGGYFGDFNITAPFGLGLSLGSGRSFVNTDDLTKEGSRKDNMIFYATLTYKFGRMVVGLGGARLITDYDLTEDDGDTWLVHAFSSFKF